MIKRRWLAKLLANVGGYFWMPCPICHEPFAGFEWGQESIQETVCTGTGVCGAGFGFSIHGAMRALNWI